MNPDIVEIWSTKIAEVAAPEEVDFAPLITEAFIQGGNERESLFSKQQENVLGGFGGTEAIMLFPLILQGIANTAQLITQILSPVSPIKDIQSILNEMKDQHETTSFNQKRMEVLPEEFRTSLKNFLEIFTDEVSKSGLPKEKCEIAAYHTLLRLLEEPSGSICFVKEVSKSKK